MTIHIMADIETLGTRPGSVVTSVALVRFTDEAHCAFNLSIPDQQALGLEIDPATEAWWATQDPVARQMALANPLPLASALPYLSTWLAWAVGGTDFQIWCHGATFDCPLLEEVFRRQGSALPVEVLAGPRHPDPVRPGVDQPERLRRPAAARRDQRCDRADARCRGGVGYIGTGACRMTCSARPTRDGHACAKCRICWDRDDDAPFCPRQVATRAHDESLGRSNEFVSALAPDPWRATR